MRVKNIYLLFSILAACTGCIPNESAMTSTPDFVTAVLPTLTLSQPTAALNPSAPATSATSSAQTSPVEGTTTTQLNVRAQPSTASAALGTIDIFTKVQIIGLDSTSGWYQILYADSSGWVRAEYVQVNTRDGIPIVDAATRSASGVSAVVVQKINVRNGPGTNFESLGVLNPNDVVFVAGKNPDGKWTQIEFANAPDGKGWTATEFLKIENGDSLPTIVATEQPTAAAINTEAKDFSFIAMQDGDSMQAPLGTVIFSPAGARALQLNNDISAPNGDTEDWLQFTSYDRIVAIKILCIGNDLRVELWDNEIRVEDFLLACGSENFITVTQNNSYLLHLSAPNTGETIYTSYTMSIENIP